jgi:hypothetical protein
LTERPQIVQSIVGRIAVHVCRRKHDAGHPISSGLNQVGPSGHSSARSRHVLAWSSYQRPSGRQRTRTRCGRPRRWHFLQHSRTVRGGSARASAEDRVVGAPAVLAWLRRLLADLSVSHKFQLHPGSPARESKQCHHTAPFRSIHLICRRAARSSHGSGAARIAAISVIPG